MIFYMGIKAAFQHQPVLEATESQSHTGSSMEVVLTSGYHFNHGGCCTVRSPGLGEGDWFSEHANNASFCDPVGRVQREWALLQRGNATRE